MDFDAAFDITRKTFNYTNHTLMSEALEKWGYDLMRSVVPEITELISRINDKMNGELRAKGRMKPGSPVCRSLPMARSIWPGWRYTAAPM